MPTGRNTDHRKWQYVAAMLTRAVRPKPIGSVTWLSIHSVGIPAVRHFDPEPVKQTERPMFIYTRNKRASEHILLPPLVCRLLAIAPPLHAHGTVTQTSNFKYTDIL